MPIQKKLTPADKRKHFIATLKKTANASRAAQSAGIASSTAYRWRATNETFRAAWDDAINGALDDLEAALLKRAVEGVAKPIMYGGKKVETVTTYSDGLGMFMLRSRRPQIYARVQVASATGVIDEQAELGEIERRLDLVAARPAPIE